MRNGPLEKDIQKACLDYLTLRNVYCWKEHSGGIMVDGGTRYMPIGLKGKSDILGLLPGGRFLAIEVKQEGGIVSDAQKEFLYNINKNGGLGFIAYSVDDLIKQGI